MIALLALLATSLRHATKLELVAGARHGVTRTDPSGSRVTSAPVGALASSIAGTVRNAGGGPIAGAVACAMSVNMGTQGSPESVCSTTNEAGAFFLAGLVPGGYVVRGTALGFSPGVANGARAIAIAAGEHKGGVDLSLTAGGAKLSGVVVDATGGAVPLATVRAEHFPGPDAIDIVADDQGRFELSTSPGMLALSAKSAGYAASNPIFPVAPAAGLVLVLTPGATIAGKVLTKDGRPVPGMRVFAQTLMATGVPSELSPPTNEAGEFTIAGLVAGSYELTAQGNRFRGFAPGPFAVDVAESIHDAVVVVDAGSAVAGRVVRQDTGEPCAAGRAQLRQPDDSATVVPTISALIDQNGGVLFDGVPQGPYAVDVFCTNQLFREGPQQLAVGGDDVLGLIWKVGPGQALVVRTVDERDRAMPFVSFMLQIPQPAGEPPGYMLQSTDAEGRYEYSSVLEPGRYVVKPNGNFRGEPVAVQLEAGAGPVTATLRLEGSSVLTVSVRTPNGEPVDGVSVVATALDAAAATTRDAGATASTSDAHAPPRMIAATSVGNGHYRLAPLAAGRYEVTVEDAVNPKASAEHGTSAMVSVAAGADAEAVLTVDHRASVTGRVLDDAGGPKPNVWVSASQHESSDPHRSGLTRSALVRGANPAHRVLTDLDGRFRIGNLDRKAIVDLRAEEVRGGVVTRRGVRAGEDVSLEFPGVGTVRGTALDADGRPVASSAVRIAQPDTGWARVTPVKPNGTWEFTEVGAGRLQLVAAENGGREATLEVQLAPRQILDQIHLILKQPSTAAGEPSPPAAERQAL